MTLAATFVDAEGAVKTWINSLTADLVGPGKALTKGAFLQQDKLHGAHSACYALLNLVGGSPVLGVENPDQRARISARIYGPNKESAALAAVAYANALVTLDGRPVAIGAPAALLLVADTITGPLWSPDFDEARYLVDADFYCRPA